MIRTLIQCFVRKRENNAVYNMKYCVNMQWSKYIFTFSLGNKMPQVTSKSCEARSTSQKFTCGPWHLSQWKRKKNGVFMKHECPQLQQSPKWAILCIKVTVTRSLTLVSFERVSLCEYAYCIPNMKSISLTVQKLWPRIKFVCATMSQTGQELNTLKFHSRGIKIVLLSWYLYVAIKLPLNTLLNPSFLLLISCMWPMSVSLSIANFSFTMHHHRQTTGECKYSKIQAKYHSFSGLVTKGVAFYRWLHSILTVCMDICIIQFSHISFFCYSLCVYKYWTENIRRVSMKQRQGYNIINYLIM